MLSARRRRHHRVLRPGLHPLLLKRRTSQNVVWGEWAAGYMPVMIGWSAVTGSIGWRRWRCSAIIFFWTPPPHLALAMKYKEGLRGPPACRCARSLRERQVTKRVVDLPG